MKNDQFLNSRFFKVAFPIIIIGSVIVLIQKGYAFGQWLYEAFH